MHIKRPHHTAPARISVSAGDSSAITIKRVTLTNFHPRCSKCQLSFWIEGLLCATPTIIDTGASRCSLGISAHFVGEICLGVWAAAIGLLSQISPNSKRSEHLFTLLIPICARFTSFDGCTLPALALPKLSFQLFSWGNTIFICNLILLGLRPGHGRRARSISKLGILYIRT
jgi:hypothetical protein